jgi:acyl-CoA thioesterase-1
MHLGRRCLFALLVALAACGRSDEFDPPSRGDAPADLPETPAAAQPEIPADAPLVAFLGDSLVAGLHLAPDEAFPAVLQRRLAREGRPFRLMNAGVSGSTTAAGLARADWILKREPEVVVICLGANDGFRGIPHEAIEKNLRAILDKVREKGARALLLGIRLPPNYGQEYVAGFDAVFARVAEETKTPFVPYFMKGVGGVAEMNLPDGIHPTPKGHRRLAENVEEALAGQLRQR